VRRRRPARRRGLDNASGQPTEAYPANPNGRTAVTTADGRFTVLMPHPERVFRNVLMSSTSGDPSALSPRMFGNARGWVR
jgi:phosphoribosylformylglycinamidine synthase